MSLWNRYGALQGVGGELDEVRIGGGWKTRCDWPRFSPRVMRSTATWESHP